MATPYPDSFPMESLSLMLSAVKGESVPVADIAHACWVVAGFGLKQFLGGGPVVSSAPDMSDEELLNLAIEHEHNNGSVSAMVIPWYAIVMLAIKLARKYIENRA